MVTFSISTELCAIVTNVENNTENNTENKHTLIIGILIG
jgi:hypothetical protein